MVMFHTYGDTSGSQSSHDARMIVCVAVVSTDRRWKRFDERWMSVMRESGVTELHMKDFAHSTGQYPSWKGDEARRKAFLRRLMALAKRWVNKSFVVAASLPDYDAYNNEYQLTERFQSPYALTQSFCLANSLAWLNKTKGANDRIQFFIESGDTGQDAFIPEAERILGWRPNVIPRNDPNTGEAYTPLQVADLIAYEYRLAYERRLDENNTRPMRGAFTELRRLLPINAGILDAEFLAKFCARSIPKRTTTN
jgi:hypothetical protein